MAYAGGAAAGAAAAHAIANAIKASGAIVKVEPEEFIKVVSLGDKPLIVHAMGGMLSKHHRYITGYKGLVFFTKSEQPLDIMTRFQLVEARSISIPD
jgi:hypothetical protein